MAKYLAMSFAIENVVSAPRVMRSCLPTSTISISFVGLLSRSTMLPASLAAEVLVAPALDDGRERGAARDGVSLADDKRGPACARDDIARLVELGRGSAPVVFDEALDGVRCALAQLASVHVDAAHPRRRREG